MTSLETPAPAGASRAGSDGGANDTNLRSVAERLAGLLVAGQGEPASEEEPFLEFDPGIGPRQLGRTGAPEDVWAVDGGQALVADARCLQVYVTRAARVRFRGGQTVALDEGELRPCLLGGAEGRQVVERLGLGLRQDTVVDVNLVRDRWEWDAVARSVEEIDPGGFVLVDGDLQADWRLPPDLVGAILERAAERDVTVVAVTKHSSLSAGGAPLIGRLELQAEEALGPGAMWWTPVARARADQVGYDFQVVAGRLDPAAPFAFRVDIPGAIDPEEALGSLAALCNDAAFPGYPYPLSAADRIAGCAPWLRREVGLDLDDLLAGLGVSPAVRERAFTDRHRLMERG